MGEQIGFCPETMVLHRPGCVCNCSHCCLPFQENKTTISSASIFNIFEMLFYICFCGARGECGKEWEAVEKGAKGNLTWGEWVGDQRMTMVAERVEDQRPALWE